MKFHALLFVMILPSLCCLSTHWHRDKRWYKAVTSIYCCLRISGIPSTASSSGAATLLSHTLQKALDWGISYRTCYFGQVHRFISSFTYKVDPTPYVAHISSDPMQNSLTPFIIWVSWYSTANLLGMHQFFHHSMHMTFYPLLLVSMPHPTNVTSFPNGKTPLVLSHASPIDWPWTEWTSGCWAMLRNWFLVISCKVFYRSNHMMWYLVDGGSHKLVHLRQCSPAASFVESNCVDVW